MLRQSNAPWDGQSGSQRASHPALGYLKFFCCTLPARGLQAAFTWDLSRKFWFSFLTVTVVCAKSLHIYAHSDSVPTRKLLLWGSTFFVQDALFLLVAFALTRTWERRWVRMLGATAVILASLILSGMAAANTSFFFLTGAEIHWRQAGGFNKDPASINTMLTGLTGLVIVEVLYVIAAALATPWLYRGVEGIIATWGSVLRAMFKSVVPVVTSLLNRFGKGSKLAAKMNSQMKAYEPVPLTDYDEEDKDQQQHTRRWKIWLKRALVIFPTAFIFFLRLLRPSNESYWFLSQTVIITPFTGVDSETKLAKLFKDHTLDGKTTALTAVPEFDWFPEGTWPGFRDWEKTPSGQNIHSHYNSTEDPLHISNLHNDVIEPLRQVLNGGDVKIKHIFLFKMESTRYDVFPLRNNSYIYERIKKSFKNDKIPKDVEQRLANLTVTAERLTGAPSGFNRNHTIKPYGGIRAEDSYTGGTFTLKSIEATTCGLSPLVVDFNHEFEHHIYQPCLPQVLDVLSAKTNNSKSDDFTNWPWRSAFMQSITDAYDKQNLLTPALGYKPENIVTVESIDAEHANDTTWTEEKFNFWGYPDSALASYFRNAITKAERDHERLFLTHLTGVTHHPWDTPGKIYEDLIGSQTNAFGGKNDGLNRYLNTIGVNDRWYETFLNILEETGVANETLIVMTGDHGLSLLEDGNVTPYDNPLVTNFHVPLVFANPNIPPIQVNSSVSSVQILPTILDLLRTSGSLDEVSTRAVNDLLPLYEGQSIIRPIITRNDKTDYYHFTVMNTGGSMVAMRSADKPFRLIVPLVPEAEWRFTDTKKDPREEKAIKSFDLGPLRDAVKSEYGEEAADWVREAARSATWWVTDNWYRYEFNPSAPQKPHESWPGGVDPMKNHH
ncbi:hypothetical protein N7462_011486 [Penicillium macrosclerotiorum]|uniref:uncharacterized protein n=1 Tax=Penicillium macrosclerotiorum TaxID=303699 RepID=UPI002549B230|nr:uncharacterized protein N7462_011486 [Penicillium macrosclerotiorum]KAJ5664673.1 hypothetical protein N7462_011486 [Penicillium macrosclerotiorum]